LFGGISLKVFVPNVRPNQTFVIDPAQEPVLSLHNFIWRELKLQEQLQVLVDTQF